ncbi:hypothetical protein D8674_020351 [Pyrus ussuriensis x Pyrus communis]|uniref:Uncharacterized protein n=1 Tax=Pyrus ussuriensis x Pyrus communis TaxID=2448454 RepID=A0A5N5HJG7_9ROSA|nr:hypothetical protein D8674_020351 [Pyrus ussuriensis x Pyrus communis]
MKAVSAPAPFVFFLLCLAIPLILFISFSLSLSVSQHHNFLLSTYEFIVVAKSNRVAVFFMFNVIFITIVFGSFRPSKEEFERYEVKNDTKEEETKVDDYYCDYSSDYEEGSEYYGSDGYDEDEDDDGSYDDDIDSEEFFGEEKDSDLERRTENFIAKVTTKWREELRYDMFMASIESQSSVSS